MECFQIQLNYILVFPKGLPWDHLFFLVFINGLNHANSSGYNNMFADDTCLYTIGKSVMEIQMSLQKCLTNTDE